MFAIDAREVGENSRQRSKLTGIVMKGKGNGPSFRPRCRSIAAPGRPMVTRLTRMMGFVEMPQAPCAPGSDSCDEDPESGDSPSVIH